MPSSHFQAAALVAAPVYPNAVAWSDENFVAVASGHIVTILNPALLVGPRGLITLPPSKPIEIGVVEREDLLSGCLLPICLSHDARPSIRSISWSNLGLAPNSGCLLAVCTTEGRVKLYRQPFSEFSAEWIEVADITDLFLDYLLQINFGESDPVSSNLFLPDQYPWAHTHHAAMAGLPNRKTGEGEYRECLAAIELDVAAATLWWGRDTVVWPMVVAPKKPKEGKTKDGQELLGAATRWADCSGGCSGCPRHSSVVVDETVVEGGRMQLGRVSHGDEKKKGTKMMRELVSFPCTLFKKGSSVEVLKQNGKERMWISGTVKRVEGPKVHVLFPGKQAQWVEYKSDPNNVNGSSGINVSAKLWKLGRMTGDGGHVTLDAPCVRLAPCWNGELRSWQVTVIKINTEDMELSEAVNTSSKLSKEKNKRLSFPEPTGRSNKKRKNSGSPPLITAEQYFSRIVMLLSTVVAWSPMFQLSPNTTCDLKNRSGSCSLLAVGSKSGKISFWRILGPECYSIDYGMASINAMLVGLLEAHNAWITTISWEIIESGAKPSAVLVTGCSDGSVRIWLTEIEGLFRASEVNHSRFSLLKEIIPATYVPISVLSLNTPSKSQDKLLLAVGKASGSLEIWICDISSCDFQATGSYEVHNQAVTGLAWAFDGCCLYSCSQDNSFRGWIMHDKSLHEMLIPSNSLGCSSSSDLPDAFDSCFGLATSPGNTVLAMVRGFDKELLNPMYQARSQRAAVEFFWIGGQQLELSLDKNLGFDIEAFSGFSETELALWEANILWSLKTYDNVDKLLVVWDVIAALLAFKQFSKDYVEHILVKWISSWFKSSYVGSSIDEILLHAPRYLSMINSRQLHLLNIICRHVMLSEIKSDLLDNEREKSVSECGEHEQSSLWIGLLISSERELRERLVAFSLAAVLSQKCSSKTATAIGRCWLPVGMAQMEQWIVGNSDCVQNQIKLLALKVKGLGKRLSHLYDAEERCTFCSASVPFESPEVACCNGETCSNGTDRRHKLERCAITMQVCPTTKMWFCACCKRRTSKLAPVTLFSLANSYIDPKSLDKSDSFQAPLKPLCPFCGILLQRLQPGFLLSASPV
ncbi:hypothetical protein Sjap_005717 [Stephania japonica]|uniref:Transcription factor IIIC 90kDa subunit N-terminal domain-containing protein n=1 Tax=Stephania japonica TaxID=461633 RepID=A0AAP0K635_9MAGN